jgi:2-amino-4-hydroxy-6-hydroxymethyldihydropteridine diphosphokinase
MKLIYLSLGSNLGVREQHLDHAVQLIGSRVGRIEAVSPYYKSPAWGFASENWFCNCCLSLRSQLQPIPLLDQLLEIEKKMGRERRGKAYSDRIIDIDLLLYGDRRMEHSRLSLPHPSMGDRRFVLLPLADIAPDLLHPVSGISISQMLQDCSDQSEVTPMI